MPVTYLLETLHNLLHVDSLAFVCGEGKIDSHPADVISGHVRGKRLGVISPGQDKELFFFECHTNFLNFLLLFQPLVFRIVTWVATELLVNNALLVSAVRKKLWIQNSARK